MLPCANRGDMECPSFHAEENVIAVKVLVVDVGGTNVKILATGERERRTFPSGSGLSPKRMVSEVKKASQDWRYDVVSIGYPGVVLKGGSLPSRTIWRQSNTC